MGVLSSLTEIVTSGLTWAVNKIVDSGAWFVAVLVAVTTWVTGTITGALTAMIQPMIEQLTPVEQAFPDIGIWFFGLFIAPYLTPLFSCLFVRFIIRRLPIIG